MKLLSPFKKFHLRFKHILIPFNFTFILVAISTIIILSSRQSQTTKNLSAAASERDTVKQHLAALTSELEALRSEDQYLINQDLEEKIKSTHDTYHSAVSSYESLLKLKEKTSENLDELDHLYAESLVLLSGLEYASASAVLTDLNNRIQNKETLLAEEAAKAAEEAAKKAATTNVPPDSGYHRQYVQTDIGTFTISIVSADLGSTRVIVDTASASDCHNNCPVLPLAEYVTRNNAFAGINGSYFCPASYPSCAGKENSFDTLLMNKDKHYFNSGNNVYSNVPAVIFGSGWIRFVSQSLEWGRDTGIDSMLANQALLIHGGNLNFGGDQDPKKGSKGGRSFVANKGSKVYIGVVHSATVIEAGRVLHTMGMENALNLDNGGSTALWSDGYKVGPGRALPNAILFIRK